ncbi:hypothetical protein Tco_1012554 [Tanacetum coccineum]
MYEKKFKVNVIEEVRDVMEFEMEEKGVVDKNKTEHKETNENGDENDMVISDSESNVESSDDGIDSEDERDEAGDGVGNGIRPQVDGGRKTEEDEESRFSGMRRKRRNWRLMLRNHLGDVWSQNQIKVDGLKVKNSDAVKQVEMAWDVKYNQTDDDVDEVVNESDEG